MCEQRDLSATGYRPWVNIPYYVKYYATLHYVIICVTIIIIISSSSSTSTSTSTSTSISMMLWYVILYYTII